MQTQEAQARRAERARAAYVAAIGRPTVFAPRMPAAPIVSPFVARALARQLPAKEYGR